METHTEIRVRFHNTRVQYEEALPRRASSLVTTHAKTELTLDDVTRDWSIATATVVFRRELLETVPEWVHNSVVEVGPAGEITTWAWVTQPHAKHPLSDPFAWALIKLDGADTPMLGAIAAASIDAVHTGLRVTPVWADEREGHINDLTHWVPVDGGNA